MSNIHCKISLMGNKFVLEDMASTNGTWLRLSRESESSDPILLQDKSVFKIGNSAMYIAKKVAPSNNDLSGQIEILKDGEEKKMNFGSECNICCNAESDCLILPCKHNFACLKCTKNLRECPVCRKTIEGIIKIYRS